MITLHPYAYVAVIVPLLAVAVVAIVLLIGEIVREWKEFKDDRHD